jgi:hypothetical protein
MTRTSLLQGVIHWKDAITANLWQYALRKLCDDLNKIPHHTKTKSPLELFAQVHVLPDIQHNHPFGCTVLVNRNFLQHYASVTLEECQAPICW